MTTILLPLAGAVVLFGLLVAVVVLLGLLVAVVVLARGRDESDRDWPYLYLRQNDGDDE
jgi:hypothetical protein